MYLTVLFIIAVFFLNTIIYGGIHMKSINKIFIISMFLFLLMGAVCAATDIESLKAPEGFSEFKNGTATFEKNNQTYYLHIDKLDSKKFQGFLSKHKDHIKEKDIGNNICSYRDDDHNTVGLIEKVKINNADYLVSTRFNDKKELSESELKSCKDILKLFNDANKLKAEPNLQEALK